MSERATRMDVELIREGRLVPTGGAVPVLADTALSLMDEVAVLTRRAECAEKAASIADRTPDAFTLTAQREQERLRADIAENRVLSLMDENERLREVVDRLQGVMIPHPFDGEQDDTVGGGVCVVCNWYRTDSIHDDPRAGLDADEFAALADTEEGLT